MSRALDGISVVDLSRVLGGPMCGQILADHGAEVIKVEPPGGDETREWGPPFDPQDRRMSAYFDGANRGKRCIAIDLRTSEGQGLLRSLLAKADVLIENFRAGTMARWGFSDEVLESQFPQLIHCQITGFGEAGPLAGMPGYDAAVQAWVGLMDINGPEDRAVRIGVPVVDLAAGLNACIGILAALHERKRSGRGQKVSTSLFETGLSLLHPHAANFFMSGKSPRRTGSAHPNIAPYESFRTRSGEIFLAVGNDEQFRRLCQELGRSDLQTDPRFQSNSSRLQNRAALCEELQSSLEKFDAETLAQSLLKIGVPAGPVQNIEEALNQSQAKSLQSQREVQGRRYVAPAIRMSRTNPDIRTRSESFGESSDKILQALGLASDEINRLKANKIVF